MIRIDVADRATADLLVTGLYMAAGLLPPPADPDPGALDLAERLAAQLDKLPAPRPRRDGAR